MINAEYDEQFQCNEYEPIVIGGSRDTRTEKLRDPLTSMIL